METMKDWKDWLCWEDSCINGLFKCVIRKNENNNLNLGKVGSEKIK